MAKRKSVDICLIYRSESDGCWIGHGLRTDQIGTGDCIVDALADFLRAIDQVFALASKEGDIEVFREAPPGIQRMAESAHPLPEEIYEIAHKRARGTWPTDLEPKFKTPRRRKFKANIPQAAMR